MMKASDDSEDQSMSSTTTATTSASGKSPSSKDPTNKTKKKKSTTKKKDKDAKRRPLSAYNLFFQLERQALLNDLEREKAINAGLLTPPSTPLPPTASDVGPLPPRYQSVTLPDGWNYRTGEAGSKNKREHRKSHGKIGFHELTKTISTRWQNADEETKAYFQGMAQNALDRHKLHLLEEKQALIKAKVLERQEGSSGSTGSATKKKAPSSSTSSSAVKKPKKSSSATNKSHQQSVPSSAVEDKMPRTPASSTAGEASRSLSPSADISDVVDAPPKKKVRTSAYQNETPIQWNERLNLLRTYKATYGDCRVPRQNKMLGKWIRFQREEYIRRHQGKSSCMSDEQASELESLGVEWTVQRRVY